MNSTCQSGVGEASGSQGPATMDSPSATRMTSIEAAPILDFGVLISSSSFSLDFR